MMLQELVIKLSLTAVRDVRDRKGEGGTPMGSGLAGRHGPRPHLHAVVHCALALRSSIDCCLLGVSGPSSEGPTIRNKSAG